MTSERIARLRERHQPAERIGHKSGPYCRAHDWLTLWPCDVAVLLEALDAAEARWDEVAYGWYTGQWDCVERALFGATSEEAIAESEANQ